MHYLQTVIENAGHDCRSYSGRGMYGKYCLGVVVSNIGEFFSNVADMLVQRACEDGENHGTVANEVDDAVSALRRMKTDSMGRDMIVYFPGITYDADEDASDDE